MLFSINSITKKSDYSALDSKALHAATLNAARSEKTATLILLEYLAEVERRRLYAEWAYSSLFEYVHKALGYSEAQSSERVSAMRLLRKVPEVKAALEKGSLTLTSTAKLASHVRREKSSLEDTLTLLKKCEGKPTREVERLLVESSTQMAPAPEKVKVITPALTRITLEVDDEFMALVIRMRELDGNPGLTLQVVFQRAMREYIKRLEVRVSKESPKRNVKLDPSSRTASRAPEVKAARTKVSRSRYIAVAVRNRIRLRSEGQCEYRDPESKRRCESRSGLEFDHILPFGKGGENGDENLRQVCRSHNLFCAVRSYGAEKMRPYIR